MRTASLLLLLLLLPSIFGLGTPVVTAEAPPQDPRPTTIPAEDPGNPNVLLHDRAHGVIGAPLRSGGGIAGGTMIVSVNDHPDADAPVDVAVHPDGSRAYVANAFSDNLTIIDLGDGHHVKTLSIGDRPSDVAVSPNGRWVVATNAFGGSATIIDTIGDVVVATVPAISASAPGAQPYQVRITADSTRAVVAYHSPTASGFAVIHLPSATLERTITAGGNSMGSFSTVSLGARGISRAVYLPFALRPDSRTIILPERFDSRVRLFDLLDGTLIATIPTEPGPTGVDVSADGSFAVVDHLIAERKFSVIDLASASVTSVQPINIVASATALDIVLHANDTRVIVGTINKLHSIGLDGSDPVTTSFSVTRRITPNADRSMVLVTSSARVHAIDPETLVQQSSVLLPGGWETAIVSTPAGPRGIVLQNVEAESFGIVGPIGPSMTLIANEPVGEPLEADAPRQMALSPTGQFLAVANRMSSTISIHEMPGAEWIGVLETGIDPRGMAWTPDGLHLLVCNRGSGTLSIFAAGSGALVAEVPVPPQPLRVLSVIGKSGETLAFVASEGTSDTLHVVHVDGAASTVVASLPMANYGVFAGIPGGEAGAMEASPTGSVIAIATTLANVVEIRKASNGTLLATVPTDATPVGLEFSSDGTRLFVANAVGDTVQEIAVAGSASAVVRTIDFQSPYSISVDADTRFLYVTQYDFGRCYVIDLADDSIVSFFNTGFDPRDGRLVELEGGTAWVVATKRDLLMVRADGPRTRVYRTVPLAGASNDMQVAPLDAQAMTSHPGSDELTVVDLPPVPALADLDGDGDVDGADLAVVLGNFGGIGAGDVNGDGIVDGADLAIVLGAFG